MAGLFGLPFSFIDILIFLNLYGLYLIPAFGTIAYFGLIKFFTFPLLTRVPHEIILVISPESARFYKTTQRYAPMFTAKKGTYWYGTPLRSRGDNNLLHVYVDGINQPVTELKRDNSKLSDVTIHKHNVKPLGKQNVYIPRTGKALHGNWAIIIDAESGEYDLRPTRQKQPFQITHFMRVGVYRKLSAKESQEVKQNQGLIELTTSGSQSSSSVAGQRAMMVTTQAVLQEIGVANIDHNLNYSASFAYFLITFGKKLEKGFMDKLLGTLPPAVLYILIAVMGIIGALVMYMLFFKPELPPPPPGVVLP